ncbi:MAG: hypothetical protein LAN83_07540 [Acidobacteriia bacterium]|nr:hypothetical protein [Terriglobia bacterium]
MTATLLQWWSDEDCRARVWEFEGRRGGKWHYETSSKSGTAETKPFPAPS